MFGVTVAYTGGKVTYKSLSDIAGKTKSVPPGHEMIRAAKAVGVITKERMIEPQ